MKHKFIMLISLVLSACIVLPVAASAAYENDNVEPQTIIVNPSTANVFVNGQSVKFDAYNIDHNNYFKLRDIAKAINGTLKEFDVIWDSDRHGISITSNHAYTSVGGELATGDTSSKYAVPYSAPVYVDGILVSLSAYTINGNNYFKLRDVGKVLDFMVTWDNAVVIDTNRGYSEQQKDYVINWTDTVIEQAARAILKKPKGDIKRSNLDFITKLTFYYSTEVYYNEDGYAKTGLGYVPIKNVSDLQHFSNLESLRFQYSRGIDFSNMPSLKKLSSLNIFICDGVSGLSGLGRLSNLTSLDMYGAGCEGSTDFRFLANLLKLENLDIARTGITDLTPLTNLYNLKTLRIYGNHCDASVISHLSGLEEVVVSSEVKNRNLLRFVPKYEDFGASF